MLLPTPPCADSMSHHPDIVSGHAQLASDRALALPPLKSKAESGSTAIAPVLEAGCEQAALEQTNADLFKSPWAGGMAQWAKVLSARPPNPNSKPETPVMAVESWYLTSAHVPCPYQLDKCDGFNRGKTLFNVHFLFLDSPD